MKPLHSTTHPGVDAYTSAGLDEKPLTLAATGFNQKRAAMVGGVLHAGADPRHGEPEQHGAQHARRVHEVDRRRQPRDKHCVTKTKIA